MSIARHHADWLSLVEVSGPFLSMPVLLRVFPQGLDPHDPDLLRSLRLAYDEWEASHNGFRPNPAVHSQWIRFVLDDVLELPGETLLEGQQIPENLSALIAEHGETLRPDFVVRDSSANGVKPRLLILKLAAGIDLEKPLPDKRWKASPATRMMELLHATGCRMGLVTNGERWMLVDAPLGETTGFASWYASIWLEEHITLRAFRSFLSGRRFFSVAPADTLEAMLAESAANQQEVTDQLGHQVRRAVEVSIQSLDKADQDHGRALLGDVPVARLYEAALTIMMRLVFLLSAEERGLLLLGDPVYDQHYAISTLQAQLRETADQHGEEVLERRFDAWCRLLATFRAVFAGIHHDRLTLPAYGGHLFDPDRFPYLEGRKPDTSWETAPANPLPASNRTVLHLLEALQYLEVRIPGGGSAERRRLTFQELGIEQIGHVYESLLDHTAKRAIEPILGLIGTKEKEPEVALSDLQRWQSEGAESLIESLHEETGRSASALRSALERRLDPQDTSRFRTACANDEQLWQRVQPFAGLVRNDTFGYPVVILPGSVYVTSGEARRITATHYTPRSLTEPIVQYTLEPLVYVGPAEGKPKEGWILKSARELLNLKICDMAMGSGAFLVQACRYLSERLVEAWENEEKARPGEFLITPEGDFSKGEPSERLIPREAAERLAIARRLVADRCLYGVDINPMAVEMAKLSLWLVTVKRDRPFTFLDHALKCGDSLLGVSTLQQVENFSLRPGARQVTFATANLFRYMEEASAKRRALEALPSNDHAQIETKNRLHAEAEAATAKVKALADCLIAFELRGPDGEAYDEQRAVAADHAELAMRKPLPEFQAYAHEQLRGRRTFHWPVEFPEVFARGGFDAFVGNPPFLGGKRITTVHGDEYTFGIKRVVSDQKGAADLAAFFLLRGYANLQDGGCLGLLLTNSINEGDTREVGLGFVRRQAGQIFRAQVNCPWPGSVGITISIVNLRKGAWNGLRLINGREVTEITEYLTDYETEAEPYRLGANAGWASTGTGVNGKGFILEPAERDAMLAAAPENLHVIQPYLTSQDINQRPDCSPSRYIINFRDMPEKEASRYTLPFQRVRELVKPVRDKLTRQVHETCFWKHWDRRDEMYAALRKLKRAIVMGRVSSQHALAFMQTDWLPFDGVVVFLWDDFAHFGLLQSSIHETWSDRFRTSLREDPRYSVSDCFATFPLPSPKVLSERAEGPATVYHDLRRQLMLSRQEGLTKTYNRFHAPSEKSGDIERLRALHVEMDQAVTAAYGWSDLDLIHGFHETKQGIRYTISESARRIVLDRLLALNHERYAEEVRQGVRDPKREKSRTKSKPGTKLSSTILFK